MQSPNKYTLKDIPTFTVDNQGYRTLHSQKERKQKILRLNRLFRAAKKFTDDEKRRKTFFHRLLFEMFSV